jgi:hypothetical protein
MNSNSQIIIYSCHLCSSTYYNLDQLQCHIKSHSQEKYIHYKKDTGEHTIHPCYTDSYFIPLCIITFFEFILAFF